MVHHGSHTHTKTDKGVHHDRHSPHTEKGQAYGNTGIKQGAGKYNWGDSLDEKSENPPLDPQDPMYDSGNEDKKEGKSTISTDNSKNA